MRFELSIDMDNAAFGDDEASQGRETARILRSIATRIECNGFTVSRVQDVNGNTVGEVSVYE